MERRRALNERTNEHVYDLYFSRKSSVAGCCVPGAPRAPTSERRIIRLHWKSSLSYDPTRTRKRFPTNDVDVACCRCFSCGIVPRELCSYCTEFFEGASSSRIFSNRHWSELVFLEEMRRPSLGISARREKLGKFSGVQQKTNQKATYPNVPCGYMIKYISFWN